jgi:hypothetical protein
VVGDHHVASTSYGMKADHRPLVSELTLDRGTWVCSDDQDQRLRAKTAIPLDPTHPRPWTVRGTRTGIRRAGWNTAQFEFLHSTSTLGTHYIIDEVLTN